MNIREQVMFCVDMHCFGLEPMNIDEQVISGVDVHYFGLEQTNIHKHVFFVLMCIISNLCFLFMLSTNLESQENCFLISEWHIIKPGSVYRKILPVLL